MIKLGFVADDLRGVKLHRARRGSGDKESCALFKALGLNEKLRHARAGEVVDALAGKAFSAGCLRAVAACERDDALKRVVDQLRTGFSDGVSYDDLAQRLLQRDEYMLLQDFASYCAAEQRMAKTYADRAAWDRMSLLNIARSGIFAADRAVAQYADNIWHVPHK